MGNGCPIYLGNHLYGACCHCHRCFSWATDGIFGILTDKGRILENRSAFVILDVIINIGRSVPFIILLIILMPVTRFLVGTTLGTTAAIVPLSVAAIPFLHA